MVSVAIFCPGSQGRGIFLYSVVQRLTLLLGNFLKFLGGGVFGFWIVIFENLDCGCGTVFI
jgi:hypothetical protein